MESLYKEAAHAGTKGVNAVDDWLKASSWLRQAMSPEEASSYARAIQPVNWSQTSMASRP